MRWHSAAPRLVMFSLGLLALAVSAATAAGQSAPRPIAFAPHPNRLIVARVDLSAANLGLRIGDQVTAVGGRRVSTPVAFWNRISSSPSTTVMVLRNGRSKSLAVGQPAPAASGLAAHRTLPAVQATSGQNGWANLSLLVMTSQGVMHRDAAARLGLAGTPLPASEAHLPRRAQD